MGVTLERVQFKFASIIGELCSEPDILSQFAVWVDLRLAEYKLKGSISLDCSGETPDPMWLKGILSALLAKRMALEKEALELTGSLGNHCSLVQSVSALHNRSSANQARETHNSDVFPVGLHLHKSAGVGICQQDRKRRASETIARSEYVRCPDVAKQRRLGGKDLDSSALPNESLMSIINAGDASDYPSIAANDENSRTCGNIKTEVDLQQHAESSEPDVRSPETIVLSGDTEHSEPGSVSHLAKEGRMTVADVDEVLHTSMMYMYGASCDPALPSSFLNSSHNCSTYRNVPRIAARCPKETSQYVKNASSAVSIFGRWFRRKSPGDSRQIEQIPPEELDDLLADFFTTVKKKDGGEYYPRSLHLLRTCLESHLKKTGYPVSITKSVFFNKSSAAFRTRKLELDSSCVEQNSKLKEFLVDQGRRRYRAIQTRCYVNKFENWARTEPRNDWRGIEHLPPDILDSYLADFLSTVTSNRKGTYGLNSLISLRSGLERHLKEMNYPHSITSSPVFIKSQQAYRARKLQLQEQQRMSTADKTQVTETELHT